MLHYERYSTDAATYGEAVVRMQCNCRTSIMYLHTALSVSHACDSLTAHTILQQLVQQSPIVHYCDYASEYSYITEQACLVHFCTHFMQYLAQHFNVTCIDHVWATDV
jgi:hypothetical protein